MLSKNHRLSSKDIKAVLQSRLGFSCENFRIRYCAASDGVARYAVVVSKKKAKTAVQRNRIRRQVYAALSDMTSLPYWVALFVQSQEIESENLQHLQGCLKSKLR